MPGQSSSHGSNLLLDRIDGPVTLFTADVRMTARTSTAE
jgi:hypothetical protein